MEKQLELLKKVKELANSPERKESEAAKAKLELLLKKYDITIDQLDDDNKESRNFKYKRGYKQLMIQVIHLICGREIPSYNCMNKSICTIWVECTTEQSIDIKVAYDFYLTKLKEEEDLLRVAFYSANKIFDRTPNEKEENDYQVDEERIRKIREKMGTIKPETFRKRIQS